MQWNVVELTDVKHEFCDENGAKWKYITKDELLSQYPNGGFCIVADMKRKECKDSDLVLVHEDQTMHLFPFRHKIKRREHVVGYIQVHGKENAYVRILSTSWIHAIAIPFYISVLCILVASIWFLSRNYIPGLEDTAVSYAIEGIENKDPDNSIALPGISIIKAKSNDPKIEFPLHNPKGNQCYMKYKLYDEDGTLIYESGLIEPGKAIKEFTMNKSFAAGNYKIRVLVEAYDIQDYKVSLNSGEMYADLQVK